MKVLIYVNKEKDNKSELLDSLKKTLSNFSVDFEVIDDTVLKNSVKADCIFSIGGDGTLLCLTEFSCKNNIPIIAINAGRLGFLTEFETNEMETAVKMFLNGELKKDCRCLIRVSYKGIDYYALNDAVIERIFYEASKDGQIINLDVSIDGVVVNKIKGNGVILSTPTGSTAYSLSAGGSILAPGIDAFSITPISAHSLSQRPIVYSSGCNCEIKLNSDVKAGLFVDGKFVSYVDKDDVVVVNKAGFNTVFYRKPNSKFFDRLSKKLKDSLVNNYE